MRLCPAPSLFLFATILLVPACGGLLAPGSSTDTIADNGPPGAPTSTAQPTVDDAGSTGDDADSSAQGTPSSHVIAQLSALIIAVAMDDATIYFACDDGTLYSVLKGGSGGPVPLAETSDDIEGIAVDATDVYFTTLVAGEIRRVPKLGGDIQTIATGQKRPWGIALNEEYAYWANQGTDDVGAPGNDGSIMSLRKIGGPEPTTLAAGEQMPTAIAIEDTTLVWADGPWGAANGMIRSFDLTSDGGAATSLAANLDNPSVLVVGGEKVYFPLDGDLGNPGTISSVPLAGGPSTTFASFATDAPLALAADASSLYYGAIGAQAGAVLKIPLGGGAPIAFALPPVLPPNLEVGEAPQFLLVDALHVFVFDYFAVTSVGEQGLIRAYTK
jgi:hypothetical protein